MDYNELKLAVLAALSRLGWIESASLAGELAKSKGIKLDIHALRMALMRYYRQGLLKRERRQGTYVYSLSERGIQRLQWLSKSVEDKDL